MGWELSQDEKTMAYYLVNLILFKQYSLARHLIKTHFLKMKKTSDLFKANVRRLQALALAEGGRFQVIDKRNRQLSGE